MKTFNEVMKLYDYTDEEINASLNEGWELSITDKLYEKFDKLTDLDIDQIKLGWDLAITASLNDWSDFINFYWNYRRKDGETPLSLMDKHLKELKEIHNL